MKYKTMSALHTVNYHTCGSSSRP